MGSLKQTIIKRDNITAEEADKQIAAAKEEFYILLEEGDFDGAYDICATYFGLEPDYIFDVVN